MATLTERSLVPPAFPAFDAAMLERTYPNLHQLIAGARAAMCGANFHGMVLHATTMNTVVGYSFGISGAFDGEWYSSGQIIHIGKYAGFNFIEDVHGNRLLLISLAASNGIDCLSQKIQHIACNRGYFDGARQAVYNLVNFEDVATFKAAVTAYMDDGMVEPVNRSAVVHSLATGSVFGAGCSLNSEQVAALAERIDPNTDDVAFGALILKLSIADLATLNAALHHYLVCGYGDPERRSDRVHALATNTTPNAKPGRELMSSYDTHAIADLVYHVSFCMEKLKHPHN